MKTLPSPSWFNDLSQVSHSRVSPPQPIVRWSLIVGCLMSLLMSTPSSAEAFVQRSINVAPTTITGTTNSISTTLNVAQLPSKMPTMLDDEDDNDDDNDEQKEDIPRKILQLNNNFESGTTSSSTTVVPKGIAVILNSNAKGVNRAMVKAIQKLSSSHKHMRVYATSNYQEAQQAVAELQQNPPQVVVPIGGDGTLTTVLQLWYDYVDHHHQSSKPLPFIGYLAMGTGNALGTVIGCNPRRRWRKRKRLQAIEEVLEQLLEIAQRMEQEQKMGDNNHDQVDIVDVPLMQVTATSTSSDSDGELTVEQQVYCFFAGMGIDSLMLQDYKELQDWSSKSKFWKNKFSSVWGYTVALFTRTLPKLMSNNSHSLSLEVTTTKPALWVDHRRGDVVRSIRLDEDDKETLLYKGRAGIVAVSTTPFYGGNLKLFPFARLSENGCQIRIGRIHPLMGVMNIPQIFSGAYRNSEMGCLDFIGTQFSVEIHDVDGHPVQHSGESMGLAQKVELQVLQEPVRFVTLLPPRLVCED
ncbi:unnamed protein product [Cylindrotheca closterium]|uniref:DAGKc domain-containing protein n=1 Tax=Cylindrotheca closterium TaxID=2856 RepID=A0AAD2G7A9_9STRA|nr:unnamed protein product [Cylindrotheca closterium]